MLLIQLYTIIIAVETLKNIFKFALTDRYVLINCNIVKENSAMLLSNVLIAICAFYFETSQIIIASRFVEWLSHLTFPNRGKSTSTKKRTDYYIYIIYMQFNLLYFILLERYRRNCFYITSRNLMQKHFLKSLFF